MIYSSHVFPSLAYYGFAGSLVLFFETQLDYTSAESVNEFYLWNGMVYVTPLVGALVADVYLGRYRTILVFSVLYVIGLLLFTFGTIPNKQKIALIFMGMYIVAIGAGGIKPNCSTLGADQFDVSNNPKDLEESKLFFSYFYWSINLGALIAYTLISYICQYGAGETLGGPDWGFFVGYSIATIIFICGIVVYVSGSPKYTIKKPEGSMIPTIAGIIYESISRTCCGNNKEFKISARVSNDDAQLDFIQKNKLTGTGDFLNAALTSNGGSYGFFEVEGAKYLWRLIPFLMVMVPFWAIYGQTKTAFQLQGCVMDNKVGTLEIPIATMNIFNNITILALVPLFETYLYPMLRKSGFELTMIRKIGLGFIIAALVMLMAAILEIIRKNNTPSENNYYDEAARNNISPCRNIDDYNPYIYQSWYAGSDDDEPANCHKTCDTIVDGLLSLDCISCDNIPQMSKISILTQIPLFAIMGVAEIFSSVTSLEFFYSQAPNTVRSVSQAGNLFTSALGSWVTIPITLLVNANPNDMWISEDINEGHLDYYFFLLASLMFVTYIIFLHISYGFKYADPAVLLALSVRSNTESLKNRLLSDQDVTITDNDDNTKI